MNFRKALDRVIGAASTGEKLGH
ncbi:hypothetical protein PHOSAC3_140031 [Mesotoga infera]|nr:hypothetical protein PHOSAC3_140031 [Mesotoga infera]